LNKAPFAFVIKNQTMKTIFILLAALVALVMTVNADDNRRSRDRIERREHHNYIIERQEAYQVQGPPTERMIIGKREIDGYHDYRTGTTLWFEGNHVVGITR
jgi:hypothetical protein